MKENFSKKISVYSFVLSLFVVIGHVTYVANTNVQLLHISERYVSGLVAWAMGYFFFVSGYLFYRNFDMKQLPRKLRSRVQSLLVPYIIWNTIAVIVLYKLYIIGLSKIWNWYININNLADGPLWYVQCIMVYFVLTPIVYLILKNKKVFWIVFLVLTVCGCVFDFGIYARYVYYFPIFFLGAGIAYHYHEQFETQFDCEKDEKYGEKGEWPKAIILLVFVSILVTFLRYDGTAWYSAAINMLIRLLAPLLTFGITRKCVINTKIDICKSSFFIYCGHEIVNEVLIHIRWVQHLFEDYAWTSQTIWGFLLYGITIIGILLGMYWILKKICPKACGVLTGGR